MKFFLEVELPKGEGLIIKENYKDTYDYSLYKGNYSKGIKVITAIIFLALCLVMIFSENEMYGSDSPELNVLLKCIYISPMIVSIIYNFIFRYKNRKNITTKKIIKLKAIAFAAYTSFIGAVYIFLCGVLFKKSRILSQLILFGIIVTLTLICVVSARYLCRRYFAKRHIAAPTAEQYVGAFIISIMIFCCLWIINKCSIYVYFIIIGMIFFIPFMIETILIIYDYTEFDRMYS